MSLRPLGNKVLLKPDPLPEQIGAIYIPDSAKNTQLSGTILSVGPGKKLNDGTVVPMNLFAGDKVYYAAFAGNKITVNGEDLIVLKEEDILAVHE